MDIIEKLRTFLNRDVNVVFTNNRTTMITAKRKADGGYSVRLHNMFVGAGEDIIKAVSDYIMGTIPSPTLLKEKRRYSQEIIRRFINDNSGKIKPLPDRQNVRPVEYLYTIGKFFDLKDIFNRLNKEYFEGAISTKITWGRNVRNGKRYIRFGSYTEKDNIIRIHPSLDRQDIPLYFIESIVYHEMLHKIVRVEIINGRRRVHTSEFKKLERRFKDYEKAREWEEKEKVRFIPL